MKRIEPHQPGRSLARGAGLALAACWIAAQAGRPGLAQDARASRRADVVVYGGTAAGVMAAVQAKRMGKSALIVCPDRHLGGLTAGGLGFTDTGNKAVIGGLAREFYHRIWKHYDRPEAWKWQTKGEYGNRGQGTPAIDGEQRTMWIFEPHVAESVMEEFVREAGIPTFRDEWLDRAAGVRRAQGRIASLKMLSGNVYSGRMFIDATYEGDLMAAAGVKYHVGREASNVYGEEWAGIQVGVLHHRHHFGVLKQPVSPYRIPGDASSGVLPRISPAPAGRRGDGDRRIQAYCFRYCATDHPENRVPFPRPEGYDPREYELLARVYEAGWRETFDKFDPLPNRKTDTNNHGPMSTDNIGRNYDYPEAGYERRREIIREHENYQKGWLYFVSHDPRVPAETREAMGKWGLARDEFRDNGNWPHQIYVREARRMVGRYVMTENELLKKRPTPESVGMGSYTIDSHNVQRYITPEGSVQNEGDIGVPTRGPYEIAFGSLLPRKEECENLLVPVCVSSSHVAYGSIRMEPVFMILGQSAATAAVMALNSKSAVQDVPYAQLRVRLLSDGQVLEFAAPENNRPTGRPAVQLPGVVVDDVDAEFTGEWGESSVSRGYIGRGYRHDGNRKDGKLSARFQGRLPAAGRYEVRLSYAPNENRSSRVAVDIHHAGGVTRVTISQKPAPPLDGSFVSAGVYDFSGDRPAVVVVTNEGSDGYVIADAVQWLPAAR